MHTLKRTNIRTAWQDMWTDSVWKQNPFKLNINPGVVCVCMFNVHMEERVRTHWNVEEMFLDNDVSMSANVLIFYRKFSCTHTHTHSSYLWLKFYKHFHSLSFALSICVRMCLCVRLYLWSYVDKHHFEFQFIFYFWLNLTYCMYCTVSMCMCVCACQCFERRMFRLSALQ